MLKYRTNWKRNKNMLDTRGSGKEYSRLQLSEMDKIADLYINDNRGIYAELLKDTDGNKVYMREWLTSHGMGDSCNFCIIHSAAELKEELKKDADHGDLPPGRISRICEDLQSIW